jgi:hypothetical protein
MAPRERSRLEIRSHVDRSSSATTTTAFRNALVAPTGTG